MAEPSVKMDDCAARLRIVSNPARFAVLRLLRRRPMSVTDIFRAVGMEQNAISHHLRVLREGGFVAARRRGKSVVYSLNADVIPESEDAIELGCCRLSFTPER